MALFGRPSEGDDARAAAWRDAIRRRDPLAVASFVLGVFSLIELGVLIVFGVAGIVLGAMALRRLRRRAPGPDAPTLGQGLAWTGVALSVASLVAAGWVYGLYRFA